jgi:hypothetical protein
VKFKTAAELDPTLVTLAELPAAPVVTVPTVIVAAAPAEPLGPKPPDTETSTVAAVLLAATSICVSPTLAVIGLAPLTVA